MTVIVETVYSDFSNDEAAAWKRIGKRMVADGSLQYERGHRPRRRSMTPSNAKDDAVEAVAIALWRAEWGPDKQPPYTWDALCAEDHEIAESWRYSARAAIEAMRAAQPNTD
jgi:hypothetical protein